MHFSNVAPFRAFPKLKVCLTSSRLENLFFTEAQYSMPIFVLRHHSLSSLRSDEDSGDSAASNNANGVSAEDDTGISLWLEDAGAEAAEADAGAEDDDVAPQNLIFREVLLPTLC